VFFAWRLYDDSQKYRWLFFVFFFKLPTVLKIDNHIMEMVLLKREARLLHMVLRILFFLFWCINLSSCIFYSIGYYYYSRGS
jgi:hypothetical protein